MEYLITIVSAGALWLLWLVVRHTDNPIGRYFQANKDAEHAAAKAHADAELAEANRKSEERAREEAERRERDERKQEQRAKDLHIQNTGAVFNAVQASDEYKAREALIVAIPTHITEEHVQLKALDHVYVDIQLDRVARNVVFAIDWGLSKVVADTVQIRKHSRILTNPDTASKVGLVVTDERAGVFKKTAHLQPGEYAYFYVQLRLQRYRAVQNAYADHTRAVFHNEPARGEQLIELHNDPQSISFYFAAELTDHIGVPGASNSKQKIQMLKEIELEADREREEIDKDPDLSPGAKANAKNEIDNMREKSLQRLFGDSE